jgi:hypothetical protein
MHKLFTILKCPENEPLEILLIFNGVRESQQLAV